MSSGFFVSSHHHNNIPVIYNLSTMRAFQAQVHLAVVTDVNILSSAEDKSK